MTALDRILLERAAREPDRPQFAFPELAAPLTVGEFAGLAHGAAAALAAEGVGTGDRVAVWAENGLPWLVLLAAAAWRGATLVTLHPGLGDGDLTEGLRRSGAGLLLAATRIRGEDVTARARRLPVRVTPFDQDAGPDALTGLQGFGRPVPAPAADPDALLNIQFTSGSTGTPKMVGLSSRALVRNAGWTAAAAGIGGGDVVASPLPLAHAAGLGSGAVLALVTGALWVSVRRFRPDDVLAQIERHRGTVLQMVPTMATMLCERLAAEPGRFDVSSLRLGYLGGAPCDAALRERVTRTLGLERLAIVYGQTEAGPTISVDPGDGSVPPGTTGRVLPELTAIVTAPGGTEPLPDGEDGELLVRGGCLADGYVDDPAATAATFIPGGWLRTGDLARLDGDVLTLAGRLKELIIKGGENVAPAEVEAALTACDGVARACVVGVPSPRWGEEVAALVVAEPGRPVDPARLMVELAGRLARHKLPTRLAFVPELPLLPSGKVDGRAATLILEGEAS
ncbi:class I adenylate-forming enzyme family protein [Sphaerisporangium rubeum]|uniref:Fatty-acyl-CoA synthase n=1 Tax=Sphaerisporangium rubeum TaxID=321317 RepID=A0A7X0IDL3_9ACTN|nr:class I adenylate-forming enzyme family protein [Sphaerisporangium rubeum]MBB6473302.1 fatty-acyl-CoA synthase [Sphaerisporangium rubeum]